MCTTSQLLFLTGNVFFSPETGQSDHPTKLGYHFFVSQGKEEKEKVPRISSTRERKETGLHALLML